MSGGKGLGIINPMIFHFILGIVVKKMESLMFEASGVTELRFILKEMFGLL